ncbi:MAG TPA: TolC family protein [Bryobacteraceae bacterium]|nr:TolC family protein [Bryobacteraceae bacterium]
MRLRSLTAILFFADAAFGQLNSFPKPSYFRQTFSRPVTAVELRPPAHLQDYVIDGKLELSLRSYLDLVMANNTDIAIQRFTVSLAENAITRAFAIFDPLATGSFSSTRQTTPSSDSLQGASTLVQLSQPANFGYQGTLPTGLQYNFNFYAQKLSTNNGFYSYNPALSANLGFSFVQPLLRNRGAYVNRLPITTASSRLRKTRFDLRSSLLLLVSNAENIYWDAVLARENLRVAESARDLADQALKRAQRELELGALSPLDIYNPQQQFASAQLGVSQARFALEQQENSMRRQMGADLDPQIRKLPVVLTENAAPETNAASADAEEEVKKAMATRPEIKSAVQNLDLDDLQVSAARNELLPNLSLTGSYTSQGVGGVCYPTTFFNCGVANNLAVVPGGLGDVLGQMFGFGFPVYSFGLQLSLPLKNHQASADLADAAVSKKRDALNVRTTQQQVRLDVLNAVSQLESSRESVKLALVARDLAQKYLDAEQKKYELGTSQIFFVLQAQQALVSAESAVVQNTVNYRRNRMNLLRSTGELLEERGIAVP